MKDLKTNEDKDEYLKMQFYLEKLARDGTIGGTRAWEEKLQLFLMAFPGWKAPA